MTPPIRSTASQVPSVKDQAEFFLRHEQEYRLGVLQTEQPHPRSAGLSEALLANTAEGLKIIQSIDNDLPPVLASTLRSKPFEQLIAAMTEALIDGRRVFFTGCGATGRLSILLEACWRRFWRESRYADAEALADQVRSVMAGGDFALIRSVEGFEDFPSFGRHQLRESGVAKGDVVVAITEGGETPFVIGTAWEAVDTGAKSFFVYNNPSNILVNHVQRSREVIEDPRIVKLDLATGPMAVAGSTRMQATTIELLVVGAALEHALSALLAHRGADSAKHHQPVDLDSMAERLRILLAEVASEQNVDSMAQLIEHEASVYRQSGLVTYFADSYLLDIMTDTTERSPTFSLPPFREQGDTSSADSWSFIKHPLLSSPLAWRDMLGREPRGLNWQAATYQAMKAPAKLLDCPPNLTRERILRFGIGNEPDTSRTDAPCSLGISLLVDHEVGQHHTPKAPFHQALLRHTSAYDQRAVLSIGPSTADPLGDEHGYAVQCTLPPSLLNLWPHIATKVVLNAVSTATMGLMGRLKGNWMVYVNTSNKKLIDRGVRLIADQTGVPYDEACHNLFITLNQPGAATMVGRQAASPVADTIARISAKQLA